MNRTPISMKAHHLILAVSLFCIATTALAERSSCGRSDNTLDNTPAFFTVVGNEATMQGYIDHTTPGVVQALLTNHPAVDTIIMDYVPGSDDDGANVVAARLIRDAGIATHVPANGVIASGGVDFFIAGALRTIDAGVCEVGVHSWAGGGVTDASMLAMDDPRHDFYLDYYREMGIDEGFYFFTINAADSNNIYNMDDTDIDMWGLKGFGGPRIIQPARPASGNAVAKAALSNKIKKLKKKFKSAKGKGQAAKAKKFKKKIKKLAKKLRAL